jgi:hypothetical protein
MSEPTRPQALRGAFVHEPPDSPTPEPARSVVEVLRRALGLAPVQDPGDPMESRGLNKQVRFLLEMLKAGVRKP